LQIDKEEEEEETTNRRNRNNTRTGRPRHEQKKHTDDRVRETDGQDAHVKKKVKKFVKIA